MGTGTPEDRVRTSVMSEEAYPCFLAEHASADPLALSEPAQAEVIGTSACHSVPVGIPDEDGGLAGEHREDEREEKRPRSHRPTTNPAVVGRRL